MPPTRERAAPAPPAAATRRRDADASSPGSSTTANSSPPSRASVSPGLQRLLQPRADLAQHLVPGVMAERVVELLEAVEVDQQQRDLARRRPRSTLSSAPSRCRRLPSPVRSSVTACRCERLSRSTIVSPARAMPVRTVTVASVAASGGRTTNCPTTSSVSAVHGVGQQRREHDRVELGRGRRGRLAHPHGDRQRDGREPRQLAERDQPHQRDRERARSPASGRGPARRRRRSRPASPPTPPRSWPRAPPPRTRP